VAYHGRWRFDVAGLMPREIGWFNKISKVKKKLTQFNN
jgi:hypothetical protein